MAPADFESVPLGFVLNSGGFRCCTSFCIVETEIDLGGLFQLCGVRNKSADGFCFIQICLNGNRLIRSIYILKTTFQSLLCYFCTLSQHKIRLNRRIFTFLFVRIEQDPPFESHRLDCVYKETCFHYCAHSSYSWALHYLSTMSPLWLRFFFQIFTFLIAAV